MSLSEKEHEQYSRNMLLPGFGKSGQEKIKASRVLVVGAGGLGCPALQYLAAAGVGTLGVMDFDIVTASNLPRQILFDVADTGKLKASCAADKLQRMNPFILVKPITERLTVKNIRKIVQEYDIIVDGTDNFMTRYLINDACVLANKPYVFGSLYRFSGQIAVFNQLLPDGTRSANYRSVFPESPAPDSALNCFETGVLGPVAGIVGTLQATETLKLITGTGEGMAGKLLLIDALKGEFTRLGLPQPQDAKPGIPDSWEKLESFDYEYFCSDAAANNQIDPAALDALLAAGDPVQLVDVREAWESDETDRLPAISISLYELPAALNQLDDTLPTVVVCATGNRSAQAVKILKGAGFQVMSLRGGIQAWLSHQKVEK